MAAKQKLFIVDIGLLSCMTDLRQKTLLGGNELFAEFKGALTEQYVLQQLINLPNISTYYYTNERSSGEIDFVIDNGEQIIPIEVKAEVNLMAKSLRAYRDKFLYTHLHGRLQTRRMAAQPAAIYD